MQLGHLQGRGVGNTDLSWLASSMWEYVQLARRLKPANISVADT